MTMIKKKLKMTVKFNTETLEQHKNIIIWISSAMVGLVGRKQPAMFGENTPVLFYSCHNTIILYWFNAVVESN